MTIAHSQDTTTMTTKKFGNNAKSYDSTMRTQLWPLCCGAAIISGFKSAATTPPDKLTTDILDVINNAIPDHQVYAGEEMKPQVTFLTLNSAQTASPKIMAAIKAAGFRQFAQGTGRNAQQGFFVRDMSGNFRLTDFVQGKSEVTPPVKKVKDGVSETTATA